MFKPSQVSLCVGMLRGAELIPDGFWPTLLVPWQVLGKVIRKQDETGVFQLCRPVETNSQAYSVFPFVFFFWQRIRSVLLRSPVTVFFDKLCIAQHDEELWLGLGWEMWAKLWAGVLLPMFSLNMFAATLPLVRVWIQGFPNCTTPINIFAREGAGFLSRIKTSWCYYPNQHIC